MRNVMRSVTVDPELIIHSVKIVTYEGSLLWAIRAASWLPNREFRHEQRRMTLLMEDGKLKIRNICGLHFSSVTDMPMDGWTIVVTEPAIIDAGFGLLPF